MDSGSVGSTVWEGYRESRRCSRDTYPESYITKYASKRKQRDVFAPSNSQSVPENEKMNAHQVREVERRETLKDMKHATNMEGMMPVAGIHSVARKENSCHQGNHKSTARYSQVTSCEVIRSPQLRKQLRTKYPRIGLLTVAHKELRSKSTSNQRVESTSRA